MILMMKNHTNDFISVFNSLKANLKNYENSLSIVADTNDNYCLNTGYDEIRKTDI
jgi:hypothetical protein